MEHTKTAKCGCGEIELQLGKDIYSVFNCHCNACRTHNGTAFTSYVVSSMEDFAVVKGEQHLASYSVDGSTKHFCRQCGSPLYNTHQNYPNIRLVYLGTLPQCRDYHPKFNVWCENQLEWVNDLGALKNFPRNSD